MTDLRQPKLKFTIPFGDREVYEAEARGYLGFAVVELPTGGTVPVVFYDPVRLRQDLEAEVAAGRPYVAEPGMIVIDSITLINMENAVRRLYEEGFFDTFVRLPDPVGPDRE